MANASLCAQDQVRKPFMFPRFSLEMAPVPIHLTITCILTPHQVMGLQVYKVVLLYFHPKLPTTTALRPTRATILA